MIDDIFVINAVSHTYNMAPSNVQANRFAHALWKHLGDGLMGMQQMLPDPLPTETIMSDWSIDLLAKTNFLENDVDMAAHHTLPLHSYFKDGFAPHSKTIEALTKYPDRFFGYVAVDPTSGVDAAIQEMDRQLDQTPNAVGLKLYPDQVDPLRSFRMDDPKVSFPLFERAQERGIRTIAVHKASPLGSVPLNPYRVDDMDGAAVHFPDLSFEIVHAGTAFIEETATALQWYPNIYANLEITCLYAVIAPKVFERVMVEFVRAGGPQKILYGDGGSLLFSSQPILDAMMAFQFSDEICEGYGIQKLTHEDKALILGGNYARIIGLNIEDAKAKIVDDEFSRIRRETGRQPAFSNWRALVTNERGSETATS